MSEEPKIEVRQLQYEQDSSWHRGNDEDHVRNVSEKGSGVRICVKMGLKSVLDN